MGQEESKAMTEAGRPVTETRASLCLAVREAVAREGVLAGLNLRDIASTAGVNRAQIYQMFGGRQGLIRSALSKVVEDGLRGRQSMRKLPFSIRRPIMFRWSIENREWARFAALLALDGADEWKLMPEFSTTLMDLDTDRRHGLIRPDVDAAAAHIATSALTLGYTIFREAFSRDSGVPLEELDERVVAVLEMFVGCVEENVDGA